MTIPDAADVKELLLIEGLQDFVALWEVQWRRLSGIPSREALVRHPSLHPPTPDSYPIWATTSPRPARQLAPAAATLREGRGYTYQPANAGAESDVGSLCEHAVYAA